MSERDDRAVDQAVEAALRRIPVPDHTPDFWERLGARLPPGPGTNGHAHLVRSGPADLRADQATSGGTEPGGVAPSGEAGDADDAVRPVGDRGRRPTRRRLVAAAAAVAIAATALAVALVQAPDGGRVETRPSDGRVTERPTTSTTAPPPTTRRTSTTAAAPRVPPGSEDAVLGFLDALGRGDISGAASRLGVASESHIGTTGGSVDDFLRQATEGYGAWAAAGDRTTSTVVLGPGEVVVVVRGTVNLEGTVEERTDAFPARFAESAEAWFVEPWALDPAGGQFELRTPAPSNGDEAAVFDRIDQVAATTPSDGTAWLAVDGQAATATTVGTEREATWSLAEPLPPGRHTLTIAFVHETTFVAISSSYVVAA